MRKVSFLFFITLTLLTKAQTSYYHPFPDSNAHWNQREGMVVGNCSYAMDYSIFFGNDTVIGSHIYHKLIRSGNDFSSSCSGSGYFYNDPFTFIRQDTIQRIVFMYNTNGDIVLYNFNLQIGDTLDSTKVSWGQYPGANFIITSIDSIFINGQYRKKFNYNNSCPTIGDSSIIEGIGGTSGLMVQPRVCFESFAVLNCFTQNGIVLYPDSSTSCNIISSTNDISNKSVKTTLYPNPFQFTTTIRINIEDTELKIYNIFGILVRSEKILDKSLTINRYALSNGIYCYQVIKDNKEIDRGKFIIE